MVKSLAFLNSGVIAQIFPLQEEVDLSEGRPLLVVPLPALGHQVQNFPWTLERCREDSDWDPAGVEAGQAGNHLLVRG